MIDRWRLGANLATLGNGLLGVGAILYTFAGNPAWAMLLIVLAIGLDGLDGILSRRSPAPPRPFGRVADSIADGVTFGAAPAVLVAYHSANVAAWHPYTTVALLVGAGYLAAAVARLTYFTLRAHDRGHFVGIPSPLAALALIAALLFHDVPAFQGVAPVGVLVGAAVVAALMVAPIPYPKIRRGALLRWPMLATSFLAAFVLVPVQFRPAPSSVAYAVAHVAAYGLLAGVGAYILAGPFTVPTSPTDSGAR